MLDDGLGLGAERIRPPEHDIGQFARFERTDLSSHAVGEGRIDRVLGEIAKNAIVVGCGLTGRHPVRQLPGPADDLTAATHAERVGVDDADRALVVEARSRPPSDRPRSHPRPGRSDIRRYEWMLPVHDHRHGHDFVDGVDRVGDRRGRGRGNDVGLGDQFDGVGNMAASRTLGVIGVHGASADRRNRVGQQSGLVEGVGVHGHGDICPIGDRQAQVDDGGGRSEILVDLEPGRSRRQ